MVCSVGPEPNARGGTRNRHQRTCARYRQRKCRPAPFSFITTTSDSFQVLTNVLPHIRFLTMTSQEFAAGPAIGGLLHQEESFAILVNLNCADKWPMPANFSTSRVARSGSAAELFHTVSVFAQRSVPFSRELQESVGRDPHGVTTGSPLLCLKPYL